MLSLNELKYTLRKSRKIHSKTSLGLQEIYTHQDSLPANIIRPNKEPFIILKLPANHQNIDYLIKNFPLFNKLGYSEIKGWDQVVTITSQRKVNIVLNAILSSPDYNHTQNEQLVESLRLLQNNLVKTNSKTIPPKSKNQAKYLPVNEPIAREKDTPPSSHAATKVRKNLQSPLEIFRG